MSVRWSIYVAPVASSDPPWLQENPDEVLPTASVGKILLLGAVAEAVRAGSLDPSRPVTRSPEDFIRDSGLWHALQQDTLPLADVCRLVGAVSDNLATNALLRVVGLDAVTAFADRLGAAPMALLDKVRTHRDSASDPGAAHTLSRSSAQSLWRMQAALADGRVDPVVTQWLSLGTDLSMVASAFDLDPLAHNTIGGEALPFVLVNKTGTDDGVRADTGIVTREGRSVAYAAIAGWEPVPSGLQLESVMLRMRMIGAQIRHRLEQPAR